MPRFAGWKSPVARPSPATPQRPALCLSKRLAILVLIYLSITYLVPVPAGVTSGRAGRDYRYIHRPPFLGFYDAAASAVGLRWLIISLTMVVFVGGGCP